MRLSLLRSPTWPDPETDQGQHEFTYSLYPHGGTWREALTVHQGYELNYPLMAVTTGQHPGPLPAEKSFFGTAEDNVVITAIKKAADDSSSLFVSTNGQGRQATFTSTCRSWQSRQQKPI